MVRRVALCALLLGVAACDKPAAPSAPPVPEVGVMQVSSRSTPLTADLVADIRAYREVELRPRVSGIIEKQLFKPGQLVREGQTLFVIDTRSLDSAVADAQAKLVEAEAQLDRAKQDVARYEPLLVDDAIPRQTYDQAVSAVKQAVSIVDSRKEGVTRARIDRSYAEVKAPVSGQVGLQKVEAGGLASAGQTVLAVVSTLDPVFAYVSVPEAEYLAFSRRIAANQPDERLRRQLPVELILSDGSKYEQTGRFDFADREVNSTTGTLTLRAVFANPADLLRPGMTGRVRVVYEVAKEAIVIPQKAVSELLGRAFVSVVLADGKVEQRPVVTGDRIGDQWLIRDGLKPGDTVIVEGLQKARPGSIVKPMPLAAPSAGAGAAAPGAAATAAKK
ncbi:MAG: efflux RND transporter periplasmic adaptor subunit [Proteobacteria bacterium]|nr:efflux RND transporter periplasmic adaptor subunit [Pseudomonadota bacterium]